MGECRVITDNIAIQNTDIEQARDICSAISDSDVRNISVANVLAANLAGKILSNEEFDVDTDSGIHNFAEVLKEVDISDIYINGKYVDVRLCIDDGVPSIPTETVKNGVIPYAYMFLKTTSELVSVELLGFLDGDDISDFDTTEKYILINNESLASFDEIETKLLSDECPDVEVNDLEIYEFLESKDIKDKYEFYNKLTHSKNSRIRLKKILNAQYVFNLISQTDSTDFSLSQEDESIVSNEQEHIFSDLLKEDSIEQEENIIDTTISLLEEPVTNIKGSEYSTVVEANLNVEDTLTDNKYVNSEIDIIDDNQNESNMGYSYESDIQEDSIDELFNENQLEDDEQNMQAAKNKNLSKIILASLLALLVAIVSYFGITKLINSQNGNQTAQKSINVNSDKQGQAEQSVSENIPMPTESVENEKTVDSNKEVGNSVAIPSIEKNLDSAVLVSNLKVDWEVPAGYASNTTAKRYMIKLGKVIQLNLKSELLLLSKLPITNTITVEVKFNNSSGQFETVGIISSSGEQNIDKIIIDTVNKALKMKLTSNHSVFNKLKGNPILVIHF
mgnify:CR=1 FL=1